MKWTQEYFTFRTGYLPVQDDLDRCNCPEAGKIGHKGCGICIHDLPVFHCNICFPLSRKPGFRRLAKRKFKNPIPSSK